MIARDRHLERLTWLFRTFPVVAVLEDLDLERLDVIHAGDRTFPLARSVRAVAASELLDEIEPLRRP